MRYALPGVVDIWHAIVHGHIHLAWDHWDTVDDLEHGDHICINLRWSLECRPSTNRKVHWRIESTISLLLSQSALRCWNFMRIYDIKHSILRKEWYCLLLHRHHTHSWSDDINFRTSGLCRVLKLLPNLAAGAPKRSWPLQPSQPFPSALFLWLSRTL